MSIGLLFLAGVVLCWRRVGGAVSRPLGVPALVAIGTMLAVGAAVIRTAWQERSADRVIGLGNRIPAAILSLTLIGAAAALSLPGSGLAGLLALWGLVAAEEGWAYWPGRCRGFSGKLPRRMQSRPIEGETPAVDNTDAPDAPQLRLAHPIPEPDDPTQPPTEEVRQQLTRRCRADGSETLSGWLRVPFAAGQRSSIVHLAFCPPFARTPKATLEQREGPETRIKTAQLLPHGARFDLKRATATDAAGVVLLQFSAQSILPQPPPGESAAHDPTKKGENTP